MRSSIVLAIVLSGCAVTSPYWGYVPASTSAPIPFQAWTPKNDAPVVVECATSTTAHGNPTDGEASYIVAANIAVSASKSLDGAGGALYSASASVILPSSCWDYFGDYDFWQANVRVSQTTNWSDGTHKVIFSSYDKPGLECLGRETGKRASWSGAVGHDCEMTYLGESTKIPYIVLRIDGYAAGASAATGAGFAPSGARRDRREVRPTVRVAGAPPVQAIDPLPPQVIDQLR